MLRDKPHHKQLLLWKDLMDQNISDPLYRNYNIEEDEIIIMTPTQIPDFIQLLNSDIVDRRTILRIRHLIKNSERSDVLDYLKEKDHRNDHCKEFLQTAKNVMIKHNQSQEHMCAVMSLLVQLISDDRLIIDSISDDEILTTAILNIFRCDIYSVELYNYLSKFMDILLDRFKSQSASNWKILLLELRREISEELKKSDYIRQVADEHKLGQLTIVALQALLNVLRPLSNLYNLDILQKKKYVLQSVFDITDLYDSLGKIMSIMIDVFKDNITVEDMIISFEQWNFINNWLPVIIYIAKIDRLNKVLFNENSENYLKVMDTMYKILSQLNQPETGYQTVAVLQRVCASKIAVQALQKTVELLAVFSTTIGVPATLTIMFLIVLRDLSTTPTMSFARETNRHRTDVKKLMTDIEQYWLLIVEKCSWLYVMGILDICKPEYRMYAIFIATQDKSGTLSTSRKLQLMEIYNYVMLYF